MVSIISQWYDSIKYTISTLLSNRTCSCLTLEIQGTNNSVLYRIKSTKIPPYKSSMATTWSPALSICVIAVVAPSPEENSKPV